MAVVLVAGGQGSRLGHKGPKGTVNIGLPSQKSLFQLQAERLLNLSKRADTMIPWYVMTSENNDQETRKFFEQNRYFGYDESFIQFFKQTSMPAITGEGKIMLGSKSEITFAPNGNGGVFEALHKSGMLADMQQRGMKWIFFNNIDNALVRVADPRFIGFADSMDAPVSSKSIRRSYPDEKVGVMCHVNDAPCVLEYSEIPAELKKEESDNNTLILENANIGIHLFKLDFVLGTLGEELPYHFAHKKVPTLDANGNQYSPERPNGYKLEKFYFDLFRKASHMSVLQVMREEEFAPVKNKDGVDSVESAREMILSLHRLWRLQADPFYEGVSEVSPLVSYEGEAMPKRM